MLSELAVRQAKAKDKDYKLSDSEGLYAHGNVVFALGHQMHCVVFVGDKAHLFGMFTQLWRVIENRTLIVVETDR